MVSVAWEPDVPLPLVPEPDVPVPEVPDVPGVPGVPVVPGVPGCPAGGGGDVSLGATAGGGAEGLGAGCSVQAPNAMPTPASAVTMKRTDMISPPMRSARDGGNSWVQRRPCAVSPLAGSGFRRYFRQAPRFLVGTVAQVLDLRRGCRDTSPRRRERGCGTRKRPHPRDRVERAGGGYVSRR